MDKISEIIKAINSCRKKVTLLGVGPMSTLVIDASIELASELDFPLFFIASRNQIDSSSLGGGYVNGWNQYQFSDYVDSVVKRTGFKGFIFKCRDHGGPWQRDSELKNSISEKEALDSAYDSYLDDLKAGFRLLHVDTSKDPDHHGVVPTQLAVSRLVNIIRNVEKLRIDLGIQDVVYEASLEETNGLTSGIEEFSDFVALLVRQLNESRLPIPTFMVGNTGTLTKMDANVGQFKSEITAELSAIVSRHAMIFKAHNCDYLSSDILRVHPTLNVGMANVAPEFGKEETEALIELSRFEEQYLKMVRDSNLQGSGLRELLWEKIKKTGKWAKWITKDHANKSESEIFSDQSLLDRIINVNGHYFFAEQDIIAARNILYANVDAITNGGLDAEGYIKNKIKSSIERYVIHLNLKGLSSDIRALQEDYAATCA